MTIQMKATPQYCGAYVSETWLLDENVVISSKVFLTSIN